MTTQTYPIAIAGITLALACQSADLYRQVEQHYHAFYSASAPDCLAEVEWQPAEPGQAVSDEYTLTFDHGVARIAAANYQGEINLADGRAWLRLRAASPWEGLEYFVRVAYACLLFEHGGLLLHGAGLVREGRAFLFFGHSGSGKTTAARLSRQTIVLNDDLVALRPLADGWQAYATPFWNPTQVAPTPAAAPLAGLYRLVQDPHVWLEDISPARAVAELISSLPVISADAGRSGLTMIRCAQLVSQVGVKRLHFRKDDTFWDVIAASLEPAR
jgi:hypothetical protein